MTTKTAGRAGWRQWLLVIAPLFAMLVAVGVLYFQAQNREDALLRRHFDQWVDTYVFDVRKTLTNNQLAVHAIEGFFTSSEVVTAEEFASFTHSLFHRGNELSRFSWNPRITASERRAFEAQQKHFYSDYSIVEPDPEKKNTAINEKLSKLVPAIARESYFPIAFIYPLQSNVAALGYDIAADPQRRETLLQAVGTGRTSLTGLIYLVQEPTDSPAVALMSPVYKALTDNPNEQDRWNAVRGVIVAPMLIRDILRTARLRSSGNGLQVKIVDITDPENPQLLQDVMHDTLAGEEESFKQEVVFEELGRTWLMSFSVPSLYLQAYKSYSPQILLMGGTLFAFLFAAFLRVIIYRQAKIERLVQERTADLHLANDAARSIVETAYDAYVSIDSHGMVTEWNRQAELTFGWKREEVLGKSLSTLIIPTQHRQAHEQGIVRYLRTGEAFVFNRRLELSALRRDGAEFPIEFSIWPTQSPDGPKFNAFLQDISQRRQSESAIRRLSRVQKVQSHINALIVRVRTREDLFKGSCRIAVEHGQLMLAWIGMLEGDWLKPVAAEGVGVEYVQQAHITISADDARGRGPSGRAMREAKPCVVNDPDTDPDYVPWRDAARAAGYRSMIACPLMVGNKVVGTFNLYAGEKAFFDKEEVALITEMVNNISYAMEFIAREEKLDYLAYYDPLTTLANRRLFLERVNQSIQIARRNQDQIMVMVLDIDKFKSVNDIYGTAIGDEVLRETAHRLSESAGGSSYVAHIERDIFSLIIQLPRQQSDLLVTLREKAWETLRRPYVASGSELRLSVKSGISLFPTDGEDAESLFRNAEAALKRAREAGEPYMFYTQQMTAALGERMRLEQGLRGALERNEFVLHYQPRVDLRSGGICGMEALLRWNSPELGLVRPDVFIPILEQSGLIVPVGLWILRQAASDARSWQAQGVVPPHIAVNISAVQLRRPDFVDTVKSAMALQPGETPRIELEVTESMLVTDLQDNIDKLGQLRSMGIEISIDDFGTGYSSLSYLAKLPISAIKIDRSFIWGMADNANTLNVVATIVSLAHSMNLRVVAEGVESAEQLRFLRLLRCDELQGFLFSRPLPADEMLRELVQGRQLPLN